MSGLGAPSDSSLAAEGGVEDGADERCGILHRLEAVGNMGKLVGGRTTLHKRRLRAVYRVCLVDRVSLVQRNQRNQIDQMDQKDRLCATRANRRSSPLLSPVSARVGSATAPYAPGWSPLSTQEFSIRLDEPRERTRPFSSERNSAREPIHP